MATDRSTPAPRSDLVRLTEATHADLEAMRLLLSGTSVIDWHRLAFADAGEVDRFLRVNEFDPVRPDDMERLEELRADAVEYLTRNFSYRIPDAVAHAMPARELFLLASSKGRRQMYACIVLKAMHVMHHLAGRELLFKLPVSDDEVFGFVEAKVVKVVEEIRAAGYPIAEFAWSRKERDSVVTKLLAKKASIAANVFDKLRFRLITRSADDLAAVLNELLHRLVPFNYVIPGESVNGILPFRRLVEETPAFARFADQLQQDLDHEQARAALQNEFSGPSYRIINFVADMPVRIDEFLVRIPDGSSVDLGSVIFVLTEFQVMDAETARKNELGENSHQAYKERQHQRVKTRLSGAEPDEGGPPILVDEDDEDDDD
ncbi:MAG TPA: TIGR04552 family protein [Polyangia bacterium]|nr:TIGR04552 family protein [Polyangia bacterium]